MMMEHIFPAEFSRPPGPGHGESGGVEVDVIKMPDGNSQSGQEALIAVGFLGDIYKKLG